MAHNFPYLQDDTFLKEFDESKVKEQFVKLIVLNFDETPIQEIQGKATGGNLALDGNSAMRRTGNINLVIDDQNSDLTKTRNLLSINKKIEVLIGFTNMTNQYLDYDIIWFPMGIYVIINPSITNDSNGINVSLTLHDKMALLNGECGGTFPASVILNQIEDKDENGNIIITKPTIYQIIQQLVHHFGGEQLGKIIISDIDNKIKQVMKWTGASPLYLYRHNEGGTEYNHFDTNYDIVKQKQDEYGGTIDTFYYGQDVGYILTDFTYPVELISKAGDSIVTMLDQIKNTLGNYEYFYDVDGNFRFQQIKNYLNTSYSTFKINEMNMNNYLVDYTSGKSVYTFENANIIISYSNSPQFQQVKNDFIVWGKRTSISGKDIPIRYHLTIDKKPEVGNEYEVFFFKDPDDDIEKAKIPLKFADRAHFPEKGQFGLFYYAIDSNIIYKWNNETNSYDETDYKLQTITTNDFRTELYMAGVASEPLGLDSNYYYTELNNEWSKLYDMKGQHFDDPSKEDIPPGFKEEILRQPNNIDFFLDFIDDTSAAFSEFSVNNIGRRTTVINEDSINCIFEPNISDLIIIQSGTSETNKIKSECEARRQEYVLVDSNIYSMLLTGGVLRSAYEEIKKELYQYTNYNEQISLTTLPIYYLEPNVRITVRDPGSAIYGDYMIKSISIPLDINGTMSLSCTRALERI